ncbi:uncharacterized protein LOC129911167 [Episyrphus balteatus]|uniref:uncharacterized protein LOC129911167 n=1 Tax=Episyrphus balteatus TaxID=286459 RepID=UPI002485C670|nr:uncharacterized protein LOC129911167 [Episyrphus balteatus]
MNQSMSLMCVATTTTVLMVLLMTDVIFCGPIQITVSDNSVYSNGESSSDGELEQHHHQEQEQNHHHQEVEARELPQHQEEDYLKISLLEPKDKIRESVNLEYEAIPSKVLTKYDSGHKKLADFTRPIPVIDTISESEKYGNTGDQFDGIARAIVNGYEAFSNLINKLIGKPKEVARSISRGITAQLDVIGGKLVGL